MLRRKLDRLKPLFDEGGRFSALHSVFEGLETFLYVSNDTSKTGVHIHDSIDSKRIMSFVVIALLPSILFGCYNIGYQNYLASGNLDSASPIEIFSYGFLAVLPKILVSYTVGLGIEFICAQYKKEEIQEGFLVSGLMIPLILPITCPLWMLAISTSFSVIFAKEIFGGTGMNIFNVALIARAFLFFSYPSAMSGDSVWIAKESIMGLGNDLPDTYTCATPLVQMVKSHNVDFSFNDLFWGFIPGSIGETSTFAILIGAVFLLIAGIASAKIMLSVFLSGALTGLALNLTGCSSILWYEHLLLGGFAFGAVFMATDPVTSTRTEFGKYVFGTLIGSLAVIIRVFNPGYPEGMMLAILFANMCAPLIDFCIVQVNISKRMKRLQ